MGLATSPQHQPNATELTISLMLNAHPGAAAHALSDGYMPLHILLREQPNASESMISLLLDAHPAAAAHSDDWIPFLHILLRYHTNATESMISLLLNAHPAAAAHITPKGNAPLHFLLQHQASATEAALACEAFKRPLKSL